MDLTTANFDRLNLDVIEDLKRVMRRTGGKEKLDYDMFADLMMKTEVQSAAVFLLILQAMVVTLKLLIFNFGLRDMKFEPVAK